MAYVTEVSTRQHCVELATRLRSEDLKEVMASRPDGDVAESLLECLNVSCKSFSVMEEGVGCIALFGVRSSEYGGVPWLLTSELLFEKSCRKFISQSKDYFKLLTDDYPFSYNYVSVTNFKAHRWLTWMGFNLNTSHTFSMNGVDFHPFTFVRKTNV